MTEPFRFILAALLGYALGSVPFGLLLTRGAGLGDIRAIGSGNIGATNVLRTGRKGLAAATLVLDGAKGAVAVVLGAAFAGPVGGALGGFAAALGHMFPLWLGFRGGKGVATGFGILLAASPLAALAAALVWLAVAAVTRISSAGALAASAAAPVLAWAITGRLAAVLALAVGALIWLRHRTNIARLLDGTEPRIGAKQ